MCNIYVVGCKIIISDFVTVLKDIKKGFSKVGKGISKLNPFKEKEDKKVVEKRRMILSENIHLLLAKLKDETKSIEKLTVYIMKKGENVGFSEVEVRTEIIDILKTIEEYKLVEEMDRTIANQEEHEVMKVKFKGGVYCPQCHAKITELPRFSSFKCQYCDAVFST